MKWIDYFLNLAEAVKLKSKDKSTQIGAVVVGEAHQLLTTGYNSFPRGINDFMEERQERPEKYFWFEHAERNAIYNAARTGTPLLNATMYITSGVPCADCARAIISSGIKEVYCKKVDTTKNTGLWAEHAKRSIKMFEEANVKLNYYE